MMICKVFASVLWIVIFLLGLLCVAGMLSVGVSLVLIGGLLFLAFRFLPGGM